MKRDMDLIRRIALATESQSAGEELSEIDGVDHDAFAMHVTWMKEAGLVDAVIQEYMGGETLAIVRRLTWDGCEFLDSARNDTLWKKAKENVMKPGASFTLDILKDWLKTEISQGFPATRALAQQAKHITGA